MSAPNGKVSTLGDSSPDLPHPSSPPRIQSALFLLAHTSGVTTLALRDAEQTQIRRQYWINDPNCSHHVGFVTFNFENYFNDMSIIRWWYLLHVFVPLLLQPAFAQFSFPKDSAELTEKVDCANAAHDHHHIRIRIEQTSTEKKNEKLPSSRKRQTYRGKICFGINRNGTAKVSIRQPIFTCITIVSSSHAWIPYSNSVVSSVCYWMKSEHITVSASVQTCQQPRIKKIGWNSANSECFGHPSQKLCRSHIRVYIHVYVFFNSSSWLFVAVASAIVPYFPLFRSTRIGKRRCFIWHSRVVNERNLFFLGVVSFWRRCRRRCCLTNTHIKRQESKCRVA